MPVKKLEQITWKDGQFIRLKDGEPVTPIPIGDPFGLLLAHGGSGASANYLKFLEESINRRYTNDKRLHDKINAYAYGLTIPSSREFSEMVVNHLLVYSIQFYKI